MAQENEHTAQDPSTNLKILEDALDVSITKNDDGTLNVKPAADKAARIVILGAPLESNITANNKGVDTRAVAFLNGRLFAGNTSKITDQEAFVPTDIAELKDGVLVPRRLTM